MKPIPLKDPDVRLAPPPDWDPETDGECGTLDAYRGNSSGYVSFWRPGPEELAALNRGAPVRLAVSARFHPPIFVGVVDDQDPQYPRVLDNFIEEKG